MSVTKSRASLGVLLLFLFAFTFAASVQIAEADGDSLCPCTFWCDCEGSVVAGEWYQIPGGGKECRGSQTNMSCVCAVCN
jgi:hypothetical protein